MDTRLLKMIEITDFESLFKKKGYSYFVNGDYNVNIIGIRNLIDGNVQDNTFNDALLFTYKVNGKWQKHIYAFTTDPGATILAKPTEAKGTAILCPGQYKGVYAIDKHQGKYLAVCQRLGDVAVYRDNNKNNILDFDPRTITVGRFGINIHRGREVGDTTAVNGYSAGCQVFKNASDFNEFMKICTKAKDLYGNKFTYTLVTSDMLTKCVC